jgi:hypothetical protein
MGRWSRTNVLFFGDGHGGERNSAERCWDLTRRLVDLTTLMGGLQQPDHSTSERGAQVAAQARAELDRRYRERAVDLVSDLAAALGLECQLRWPEDRAAKR